MTAELGTVPQVGAQLPRVERTYRNLEVFLFSAATWNAHRVHYDRQYAVEVEGHTDLLVQGPLQAVHIFQAVAAAFGAAAQLKALEYRHLAPLHVGETAVICGEVVAVDEARREATVEAWMQHAGSEQRTTQGRAVVAFGGAPG
jgi:3-methylfumaryl-CoA hydratase